MRWLDRLRGRVPAPDNPAAEEPWKPTGLGLRAVFLSRPHDAEAMALDVMAAALDTLDIPGRKRVMNNVWTRFVVEPESAAEAAAAVAAPKGPAN